MESNLVPVPPPSASAASPGYPASDADCDVQADKYLASESQDPPTLKRDSLSELQSAARGGPAPQLPMQVPPRPPRPPTATAPAAVPQPMVPMSYHNTEITAYTDSEEPAEMSTAATTAAASDAGSAATSVASVPAAAGLPHRPQGHSASAATSPCATANTPAAELSDVPLDVLSSLILPRLPPGHRLDVRAVSRRWAAWVDGALVPNTHINLVLDRQELEAASIAAAAATTVATAAAAAVGEGGGGVAEAAGAAGAAGGWGAWLSHRAMGGTASSHGATGPQAASGAEVSVRQSPQAGVLARRFPSAVAARLWVGCRPPASVAGTNGGGLAARALDETAAAAAAAARAGSRNPLRRWGSGRRGGDPSAGAVSLSGRSSTSTTGGHHGPLELYRSLSTSLTAALEDCCSRAAHAPGRIAAAAADLLLVSSSCLFPVASATMRRRLGGGDYYGGRRGWRRGAGGAGGRPQPTFRWHVHKQKVQEGGGGRGSRPAVVRNADGTFQLLRRYSQDALEPQALPPLPQCLPLLGGSAALRRLSLVTAYDLTAESLELLASAFPNLTALSLHAHHAPGVDATPVSLRHRTPTSAMTCTTLADARATAAAANAVGSRTLSTTAAGRAGADGLMSRGAAQGISNSGGDRQLRRRHSGVAEAVMAEAAARADAAEQQHWALRSPLASRLPQLTTLALCGLRLGDPEAEVLGALSGLRALTLHRVTCRVHRLLPHIESGLTRLTRLELRRLDYFHSLPMDAADNAALEARELRRAVADANRGASRHTARLQRQEDAARRRAARLAARRRPLLSSLLGRGSGSGADGTGGGADQEASDIAAANAATKEAAAFADLLSGPDSDAEEEERVEEAALDADLEEEGMAGAPWMTRQSRGLFPDWPGALWSLGRTLRRLPGLQVLVADVECPARGQQDAWAALLLGVKQLHGLTELRLPHLAFGSAWQVRSLAAALPLLTCLEFGSLPPVPRTPEVVAWLAAGGRPAGFRAHALGPHVACSGPSSRMRGSHGPPLPPHVLHPAFASREMLGWCYLSEEGAHQGQLLAAAATARAGTAGALFKEDQASPLRRSNLGAAGLGRDGTGSSDRCRRASDSSGGLLRARAAAARPDCTVEDGLAPGSGSSSGSDSRSSSAGRRRASSSGHGLLPSRFSGSGTAAAAAAASGHPSPLGLVGAGEAGAAAGDVGGLCCFKQLRRLVVRRAGLEELAVHGLPLPPRLTRAELPLQAMVGAGHDSQPVQFSDLLLLHSSLLPALAALPALNNLHLTLGPARGADGPLLAAMLGAWLGPGGAVRGLDVRGLTHPSSASGGEVTETLQRIASGLPRLERLSCYLWGGPGGLLQPETTAATTGSGSSSTAGGSSSTTSPGRNKSWTQRMLQPITTAAAQLGGMRRSPSGAAVAAAPPAPAPPPGRALGGRALTVSTAGGKNAEGWLAAADAPGVRLGGAVLEAINCLPLLDELRVKVLSLPASAAGSGQQPPGWGGDDMLAALRRPTAASRFGSCTVRVPLGLLRGLRRALHVVDCSPLESWCSSPFAVEGGAGSGAAAAQAEAEADPRVALAYARGLLAAEGVCVTLVAEAEEWAAGAIGVGPDLEERWRGEALPHGAPVR